MYNPGALDQIITISRLLIKGDGYGGEEGAPQIISREWALVKPMAGGEKKEHERVHDTSKYLFVIRYRQDLAENDFIFWSGQEFNIRFIRDFGGRRLYLEIEAERNAQR